MFTIAYEKYDSNSLKASVIIVLSVILEYNIYCIACVPIRYTQRRSI